MFPRKNPVFVLAILAALLAAPTAALSDNPTYLKITGERQGVIEGSCSSEKHRNEICVYGFGHKVYVPTDIQTGQASGRRVHAPVEILKEVDKSTPKLFQALVTGERLPEVSISFYHTGSEGQSEHFFTIFLEDAIITKITPSLSGTAETQGFGAMEIVSITYRKITWTHETESIEATDDWETAK
jgi:type VI secretion system secreted protein Hcp